MRIICVNTGDKFGQWYVDNLKYMIDNYSGLKYDSFEVITEEKHKGVFNKLQMFDKFRDGENLYFDLDICIYNKVPNLVREELTVLNAAPVYTLSRELVVSHHSCPAIGEVGALVLAKFSNNLIVFSFKNSP